MAGSRHPVPAHPVPACPLWMPQDGEGHAEIIGCLPGRGSCRPAGGSSGSNKEQDQGGSNPAAPGAPGPDGFQMQPLACERSRGALELWPGEGRAALPGHLPGSATPGEIIFPQQGGSLRAELHQAPIDARAVKGEALASRSTLGQRCNELTRPQPGPQGAGVVLGAGGRGPRGWELCQERGAPAERGGAGGRRRGLGPATSANSLPSPHLPARVSLTPAGKSCHHHCHHPSLPSPSRGCPDDTGHGAGARVSQKPPCRGYGSPRPACPGTLRFPVHSPRLPGCLPSTQETRDFTTQPRQD